MSNMVILQRLYGEEFSGVKWSVFLHSSAINSQISAGRNIYMVSDYRFNVPYHKSRVICRFSFYMWTKRSEIYLDFGRHIVRMNVIQERRCCDLPLLHQKVSIRLIASIRSVVSEYHKTASSYIPNEQQRTRAVMLEGSDHNYRCLTVNGETLPPPEDNLSSRTMSDFGNTSDVCPV